MFDENGIYQGTVNYDRLYVGEEQSEFDRNFRKSLGKAANEWIDIDSYGPDMYDLDMFSADEVLNNGNNYVSYYGYDHTGKKSTGAPATFEDFFTKEDEFGNKTRDIAAFQPIYVAGFIMDKFAFDDIILFYFLIGYYFIVR